MHSELILPLVVDRTPVGTFNFAKRETGFYTQTHCDLAGTFTSALDILAKQIQASQDEEARHDVALQFQKAKNVDTVLNALLHHLQTRYDRIRVYLYDPGIDGLIGHMQAGPEQVAEFSASVYPIAQDPHSKQTFSSDAPKVYSTRTNEHENLKETLGPRVILVSKTVPQWAEFPLKLFIDGRHVIEGKISVDNSVTSAPINEDQLKRQMVLISLATLAIHRTNMRINMADEVDQRTHQPSATNKVLEEKDKLLTALQEVSHRSFSYLNQDEILDTFARLIIQAGIFRSLMIALVDRETESIEVVRAFQKELPDGPNGPVNIVNYEKTCGTRYPLSDDNITPTAARTGEMQIAEFKSDSRLESRFEENQNWDDKIAYFIPVRREEKVVAVLATGTQRRDKALFIDHVKTMEPLFDQLGIALEHAALYHTARKNEAHYRSLFENMQSAFAYHQPITDRKGKPQNYVFLEVNQAFEEITRLKRADIIGQLVTTVLPGSKEDLADWIGRFGQVAQTGKATHFESYFQALGQWYSVSAYSPQQGYFVTLLTEITERKKSEERMGELLDFQVQMLNTPVVWICAFGEDLKMTFWNHAAELISGYSSEEVLGSEDIWQKLYPDPDNLQTLVNTAKEVLSHEGRIVNIESAIQCKEGKTKIIYWHANRLISRQGEALGYLAIGLDVSHHKQLETEIVRLERLKALVELAAGVSHNLNNMLTGILLPAAVLNEMSLPSGAVENVEDILVSATRARDLVSQLSQSVRKDPPETSEPVDTNRVVSQAVRATQARWKDECRSRGIQVGITLDTGNTPLVKATTAGLHDVLVNLIFNAVDALPEGGIINISTRPLPDGSQISVQDDGVGMSSDTRLRVFEPFFTTKMNVGTGLGLSTAYNHVQRWGGELSVESELGRGTVFTIKLSDWSPGKK
jgi:PAS domain S-box-containing protein